VLAILPYWLQIPSKRMLGIVMRLTDVGYWMRADNNFNPLNYYRPKMIGFLLMSNILVGGHAEFIDPVGTIEGKAVACFDDDGKQHISMQVEKASSGLRTIELFSDVNNENSYWEVHFPKRENSPYSR
jgi:hypothetical protein